MSLSHRNVPNLKPEDKDKLKDILDKQKDKIPLTREENKDLKDLKDKLRPDVPYDESHPSYDKLKPEEKKKLDGINKKLENGKPLTK